MPSPSPTHRASPSWTSAGRPKTRPARLTEQLIALGPVAVLEPIKNLGTNGGGFFNVNGAHPFENPTPLTNMLHLLAIAVLPASLTHTFGRMTGRPRQGWVLFSVMLVLFVGGLAAGQIAEQGARTMAAAGVDHGRSPVQAGGNMEGKEARFGIGASVLGAVTTSNGATGSYNSMHDSYTPLGGMVTIVNMLLGEVVFGGLGTGLYSLVLVALVGVFAAGLMIGRTPEYLGKQITASEMKLVAICTIVSPLTILPLTALAVVTGAGLAGLTTNTGAHGLSEILVAYTTSVANNGQNFAGLSANTPSLQRHDRPGHDGRSLRPRRARAGPGRALRDAAAQAHQRREPPHGHSPLRRAHPRDDPDRGRAELLPRPGAWSDRRAPVPAMSGGPLALTGS